MYGTRDAVQNWEFAYAESLEGLGFKRGRATPCAFYHPEHNIRLVVHGDDFTALAHEQDLDWFRRSISEVFDVKFRGRIGPSSTDSKAIRILNRVVHWTEEGIEYEADQRHADIIVRELSLGAGTKPVTTLGIKRDITALDEADLDSSDATRYRALVARGNYLSQNRSDICLGVTDLCRNMSSPSEADWGCAQEVREIYLWQGESCYQVSLSGII